MDLAWASEEERKGGARSRMLFPLRTGVELFSDPAMPHAIVRAKQAAVLYDEIVFETGLYEVSVAEGGSNDRWHPQESLTDEQLVRGRQIQTAGTPYSVAIGPEGGDHMVELMNSPLLVAYASEYHSGILDELAAFNAEWVKVLTLGNKPPMGTEEGRLFRRRDRQDRRDSELMPEAKQGRGQFRRNWIIKTFNRDLIVSSLIGASFSPTSLFAPMIDRRGLRPSSDGRTALQIAVPNLGVLPWAAVVEFRNHGGSAEARAMLREFEIKAALEEPEDAEAYLKSVARDVTRAMAGAAQAQSRKWPARIAATVLGTVVGLEPHIGHIAGPALAAGELGLEWLRERRSWTAALMVLNTGQS